MKWLFSTIKYFSEYYFNPSQYVVSGCLLLRYCALLRTTPLSTSDYANYRTVFAWDAQQQQQAQRQAKTPTERNANAFEVCNKCCVCAWAFDDDLSSVLSFNTLLAPHVVHDDERGGACFSFSPFQNTIPNRLSELSCLGSCAFYTL